jgi:branched-chain amino acid transport system substrate-binding protein
MVLVLLVLAFTACGDDDDTDGQAAGGGSQESEVAGTLKVGANMELSGPSADLGLSRLYGYRAAVAEINESGGVKVGDETYELELVECDNETDPTQGVQCSRTLSEEEDMIMATAPDQGFEAGYEILKRTDMLVMGSGGAATVLLAEDAAAHPSLFNEGYGFDLITEAYFNQIQALRPDVKTFAALLPNDENGDAFQDLFTGASEKTGIEYLGAELHPPGATGDFSSFLTSLKAKNPDMVFVSFYTEVTVAAAQQATNLDVAPVLGSLSVQPSALADTDFRGHELILQQIGWDNSALEALSPENKQAFEEIDAASDGEDYVAAVASNGYLAVKMLQAAIEQAGSIDPKDLQEAMLTAEYDGPLGPAVMDAELHSMKVPLTTIVFNEDGTVELTVWDSIDATEPTETFPVEGLN